VLPSRPRFSARIVSVAIALTAIASLAGCSGSSPQQQAAPSTGRSGTPTAGLAPAAATTAYRLVAAGDIACPPGSAVTATTCRQADTARLVAAQSPHAVVPVGDLQYERGSLSDFQGSYAKSWGALKSITRPVVGNHEYKTAGATGYYSYFGRRSPGYYAWDAGTWRVYSTLVYKGMLTRRSSRLESALALVHSALQHQHVPVVAARAPVPLRRAQRRDQHAARQHQLDARARGAARSPTCSATT
jgi:hypothetical protein